MAPQRGLVLPPAVAWGSWQGGCLYRWALRGLEFSSVLGISAGSTNGIAWAQGDFEFLKSWNTLSNRAMYTPAPRLSPRSLFSFEGLRGMMSWVDEERFRKNSRCVLHVATLCMDDGKPWIAEFDPKGRWDSPLMEHLLASCAIPGVFPPVSLHLNGATKTLIDGGIAGKEALSYRCVGDNDEVFILDAARPDDAVGWSPNPLAWINNKCRARGHEQIRTGIDSLKTSPRRPRLYRFYPSRTLDYFVMNFGAGECREAFALGMRDADAFAENFESYRA